MNEYRMSSGQDAAIPGHGHEFILTKAAPGLYRTKADPRVRNAHRGIAWQGAAAALANDRIVHVAAIVRSELLRKALSRSHCLNSIGIALLTCMRLARRCAAILFPVPKEIRMHKPSIAILLSSMLLAGGAIAQVNPTTPKDRSDHGAGHAASTNKGPSGISRDGNVPSVNRRSDAAGSPGATNNSDRLAAPSGASSSGATGTGNGSSGGSIQQPGSGMKSSGTAGSAAGSGASDAAGSGGMGGGATGGTMR